MDSVDLNALQIQQEPNVESIAAWTTSMFVVELPEHEVLKDDLLPYAYQVRQSADSAIASQVAVSAKNNLNIESKETNASINTKEKKLKT